MDALASFLDMGGDARFVWPAYGVAVAVLGGLWFASRRRLVRAERELGRLEAADPPDAAGRREAGS